MSVSKDAAITAERRDTRLSHSLGAYPPASYHNVPSMWSQATALAVLDIGTDSRVQSLLVRALLSHRRLVPDRPRTPGAFMCSRALLCYQKDLWVLLG